MTRHARTLLACLLLVALTAVVAAGCGGGGDTEAAQAAPATTSVAPAQNAALAALPSPGDVDLKTLAYPGPEDTYVGAVGDTGFFLGISIVDGDAAGYLCDGELPDGDLDDPEAVEAAFEATNDAAASAWLKGSADGETVTLAAADGSGFTGTVEGEALSGSVTLPDGTSHEVSLTKATGTTSDGLYRFATSTEDAKLTGGWVRADGQVRGKVVVETVQAVGQAIGNALGAVGDCVRLSRTMQIWHALMIEHAGEAGGNTAQQNLQNLNEDFEAMGCPDGLLLVDRRLLDGAGAILP